LRYGPYLIAMNMTKDRSFDLAVPADLAQGVELVSGRPVKEGSMKVGPRSTVVLCRNAAD
jgi:hypothetical protein